MSYTRSTPPSLQALVEMSPWLWLVAFGFFGVGDLVTTVIGLSTGTAAEVGPLPALLVEQYGLSIIYVLKIGTFAILLGLWRLLPSPHRVGIPLALAVMGVLVTVWNVGILLHPFIG